MRYCSLAWLLGEVVYLVWTERAGEIRAISCRKGTKHETKRYFKAFFSAETIATAPESVEDADCPCDPNDAAAVESFWDKAIVSNSLLELQAKLAERRYRGPGKAARKISTTIRFDPDVLAALRATGKGWQTRGNDAMRDWLKAHSA